MGSGGPSVVAEIGGGGGGLGEGSWVTASDSKTNVAKVCKADITDSLQMVAMEIKDCAEFNFAEIAELN